MATLLQLLQARHQSPTPLYAAGQATVQQARAEAAQREARNARRRQLRAQRAA